MRLSEVEWVEWVGCGWLDGWAGWIERIEWD